MVTSKKRWIGWALAASVAFNLFLPFFATYGDAAAPKLPALFGDKVLICTGSGFTWVKWEDLQSGKLPAKQHKGAFCPLCYFAASGAGKLLLPGGLPVLSLREATAIVSPPYAYDARLKPFALAASRPRAPPVSFAG